MSNNVDMSLWQGRADTGETGETRRWHQGIRAWESGQNEAAVVLTGLASDEGVRRNKGRPGATAGPAALRRALAPLTLPPTDKLYDAGDISCDGDMEASHSEYVRRMTAILESGALAVGLGGGHDIAWSSYSALRNHLANRPGEHAPQIGIINFDAHLDLRNPAEGASSGTPFRQIAESCAAMEWPFHYAVIGVNPSANTPALFDFARQHNVLMVEDIAISNQRIIDICQRLNQFMDQLDGLYISICLDVFPAAYAPGVSAPAALGVEPVLVMRLLNAIGELARAKGLPIYLVDVAEMNPDYDRDQITARLGARVIQTLVEMRFPRDSMDHWNRSLAAIDH